jgi:hypothetical protein
MNEQEATMLVEPLVALIEAHPVNRHQVFEVLAKERPPPEKLEAWLRHMAWFCVLARDVFSMPSNLRYHELDETAKIIEKVQENERQHGELYATMAHKLLGRPAKLHETRTPAIEKMKGIFVNRDYDDFECVYKALGAYLALDVMTDHHIVPEQIKAFVMSRKYGLSLSELEYLRKHYAEYSAATVHGLKLRSAIMIVPHKHNAYTHVEQGVEEFMDALHLFYDELTDILVKP